VLARSKELLVQDQERYCQVDPNGLKRSGVYSAGLGIRQTSEQVTFAGVQSVYKRAAEIGHIDAIVVDESHQISNDKDSQYQQLIRGLREINPNCRFIGLTATPYRLDGGINYGGASTLFDRLSYNTPLSLMFDEGYLTKPVTLPTTQVDMSGVKKTGGDYNKAEMQSAFLDYWVKGNKTLEIKQAADSKDCKSIVVYCSGVAHASLVHHELLQLGEESVCVTGETLPLIRATALDLFANRKKRWIINVDVLTTGWDAPNVDCVVMARATQSAGLFMQIVGRGTRLYPNKEQFYVIDMGGNIERHGAIDSESYGCDTIKDPQVGEGEAPKKVCVRCFEIVHASAKTCPKCGFVFPERTKDLSSTNESITVKTTKHRVVTEAYKVWAGKEVNVSAGKTFKKPDTLLVQYKLEVDEDAEIGKKKRWAREWICFNHTGFAKEKADKWWAARSHTMPPSSVEEAIVLIDAGALAKTIQVSIRPDGKFEKITNYIIGDKPQSEEIEELPF
jgi:DNA repair protein RadD